MRIRSLACLALPCALSAQGFVDITSTSGVAVTNHPIPPGAHGRGGCSADFDADGDLDLILPQLGGHPILYFENNGDGTFVDRTAQANLPASLDTISLSAADYDNDGDTDLFIGRMTSDSLYENDGTGSFTDRTAWIGGGSPHPTYGASFGDFDNDGWLDMALSVWSPNVTNLVFHNQGGTGFQEIGSGLGLNEVSMTFVCLWMDYDDDGQLDLYTVNDKGSLLHPNAMYRNTGGQLFIDVAPTIGADAAIFSMGGDFLDAFNDGGEDIYVTDAAPDHLFLVWDEVNSVYTEEQATFGVHGGLGYNGWGCEFVDYDNDGWQDIHYVDEDQPNPLYRNPGQPVTAGAPWPNLTLPLGLGNGRNQATMVLADFDNDGRVDVLNMYRDAPNPGPGVEIYRNEVAAGNWIRFRTVGTTSNRDGFGAKIRVFAGGLVQNQTRRHGVGLAGTSDHRVHFGLGTASTVDRVEVRWPSGQTQLLTDVPANQDVVLIEPSFDIIGPIALGTTSVLSLDVQGDEGSTYAMPLSATPGSTTLPSGRSIPLSFDLLSAATLVIGNAVTPTGVGTLDATGHGQTGLIVPSSPALSGLTFYTTALTIDSSEPESIRTILPGRAILIP